MWHFQELSWAANFILHSVTLTTCSHNYRSSVRLHLNFSLTANWSVMLMAAAASCRAAAGGVVLVLDVLKGGGASSTSLSEFSLDFFLFWQPSSVPLSQMQFLSRELCFAICPVKIRHWGPLNAVMAALVPRWPRDMKETWSSRGDFVFLSTLEQSPHSSEESVNNIFPYCAIRKGRVSLNEYKQHFKRFWQIPPTQKRKKMQANCLKPWKTNLCEALESLLIWQLQCQGGQVKSRLTEHWSSLNLQQPGWNGQLQPLRVAQSHCDKVELS